MFVISFPHPLRLLLIWSDPLAELFEVAQHCNNPIASLSHAEEVDHGTWPMENLTAVHNLDGKRVNKLTGCQSRRGYRPIPDFGR